VLNKNKKLITDVIIGNSVSIYFDPNDWDHCPVIKSEKSNIYVSGWFINENYERNNIEWLKDTLDSKNNISDVQKRIIAGVFICIYETKSEMFVFTDPFALSPHYYYIKDNKLALSPSPCVFTNEIDHELNDILNAQGHLFGKYTIYKNVYRILPGDVITCTDGKLGVYENGYEVMNTELPFDVINEAKKLILTTHKSIQSIAISAGFDSRLLLIVSEPEFAYTWGPKGSADVRNGKTLAAHKKIPHHSFGFRVNKVTESDERICELLFKGSVKSYNTQFFANYNYVHNLSKSNTIALDGYLGDVLQRGVYMTFGGKKGEFYKLFPSITSSFVDAKMLLRKRYRKLNAKQFDYVYADFLKKVSKVECIDSLQKITYYEFLYGRGLRYITTGAIVMNSCFKSVFPVFASRNIFNYLIKQRANDVLTYKVFYDIWKDENAFYRTMKSEGAYSPSMKPIFIPFANLLGRIITNFHPKYKNYTKE
ncbi:TPA: hypothetical protein ACWK4N_004712, partial [Escherichia coli]